MDVPVKADSGSVLIADGRVLGSVSVGGEAAKATVSFGAGKTGVDFESKILSLTNQVLWQPFKGAFKMLGLLKQFTKESPYVQNRFRCHSR